jgi:S1-C subfamily serine protease
MLENDSDSGSEQRGGWQPPEYVSPWVSSSADKDSSGDTISYGQPPGYDQPGYAVPGQGDPRAGQPPAGGYGAGGYGAWSGGPSGQDPWGYAPPPPPQGSRFGKFLAYVAVAALAAGAGAGAAVALNHSSNPSSASSPQNLNPQTGGGDPNGNGFPFGNGFDPGSNGQPGANAGNGSLNAGALAGKVNPGVVDITSQLKYNEATAEGTGIIISSDGLVLTNNHVINQATSVTGRSVTSGKTYSAKVLGYDSKDDVALLRLEGASGLKAVTLADSGKVKVGDAVLALGNAGGRGGLPSTAQGVISGLNRTIKASDGGDSSTETLQGMIQTNAPIQEGDSGGPLVNAAGAVVGIDTAANTSTSPTTPTVGTTGFAIPINRAVSIASQISAGRASDTVHIGLAGFIGINVADTSKASDCASSGAGLGGGGNHTPPVKSGALVCNVFPGTPAATAGIADGDVITSINGHTVSTANGLTGLMADDHPGDQLTVEYVDQRGTTHTTHVTLSAWAR